MLILKNLIAFNVLLKYNAEQENTQQEDLNEDV